MKLILDICFRTCGTRDPDSSRALITSPLYQSWETSCWKSINVYISTIAHLHDEHLTHLLLGDEGEGEPLVARPPCAADSVHSVQREITSPPPMLQKLKRTSENLKWDPHLQGKKDLKRLPTALFVHFVNSTMWNVDPFIITSKQMSEKLHPTFGRYKKSKKLVGILSKRIQYLWT